jgi:2'-hydroxyisoflavone reductase
MKVLILGGTQFVGRHFTEQALLRGYEVTLFNRGHTGATLFPDVETLKGDRDGDLQALKGRYWDAVIDPAGYIPRHVRDSATLLADATEHYTFVSTLSVYTETPHPNADENAPLATLAPEDEGTEIVNNATYGALKVLCERAAEDAMPGRVLIVRPGYIVGPYDNIEAFTYWIMRFADKAYPHVIVPDVPHLPLQVIDARDLVRFTLDNLEARQTGIYNTVGPERPLTLFQYFDALQNVLGRNVTLHPVAEELLLARGVQPKKDIPLWAVGDEVNLDLVNIDKAVAAGLTFLPLETTIVDTYAWRQTIDAPMKAGWSREREMEFIEA